jgi:hypothetical protein
LLKDIILKGCSFSILILLNPAKKMPRLAILKSVINVMKNAPITIEASC